MGKAKGVIDLTWEILDGKQFERLEEVYHDDMEQVMPIGTLRSLQEIRAMLADHLEAFPDLRHDVIDTIESGDTLAQEIRVVGTHTGTLRTPKGDVPATGRKIELRNCIYVKLREGKVQTWHAYYDQVQFRTQLGLIE